MLAKGPKCAMVHFSLNQVSNAIPTETFPYSNEMSLAMCENVDALRTLPNYSSEEKKSRVIYKSQLQSAVHVTLCFVFHLVLILSFGFPPFFMRKNRVRDKFLFLTDAVTRCCADTRCHV